MSNAAVQRVTDYLRRTAGAAPADADLLRRVVADRDQAAFAALVRRHGPAVRAACRRVVGDTPDADDAFQATFLVLWQSPGRIQRSGSVGAWLYGTAHRIACQARAAAARRRRHETHVSTLAPRETLAPDLGWQEACAALHEELNRLPDRYRLPLVLCYLHGLSRDEAAGQLGWTIDSVKGRLERGRDRLRRRLMRRGIDLSAGLLTALVGETSSAAVAPTVLVRTVVEAAAGVPSKAVAALVHGPVAVTHGKLAVAVVVVSLAMAGAGVGLFVPAEAPRAGPAPAKVAAVSAALPELMKGITVVGRVVGPDGRPLPGAHLFLTSKSGRTSAPQPTTDADGRFRFVLNPTTAYGYLIAVAPGMGADFLAIDPTSAGDMSLALTADVPIHGRVIDTQGRPVAGVEVTTRYIGVFAANSIEPLLAEWKTRHPMSGLPYGTKSLRGEKLSPAITTDADGRFTINGVGAERVVGLYLRGRGIADAEIWVVTRAGFDPRPFNDSTTNKVAMMKGFDLGPQYLLNGPDPTIVAEIEKPIRGVVTDRDTGKPRAGVTVRLGRYGKALAAVRVSATTDAVGRYEIHGVRKADAYMVEIAGDPITGHMACQVRGSDSPGYEPLTIDVAVKKGVIVSGRMIDKTTGHPVSGFATVSVLADNPFAKDYPEFDSSSGGDERIETAIDGSFRCVAIPGPVILMGGPYSIISHFQYKPPAKDPKYERYFVNVDKPFLESCYFGANGRISHLEGNFAKVLEIAPGTEVVAQDIVLEIGTALPIKIRDAADRPLAATWATGISPENWHRPVRIDSDICSVYHLVAGKSRIAVFYEPSRGLIGSLTLKGDETQEVTVNLGPGATIKGRLVDEAGKPLAKVAVEMFHRDRAAEEIHQFACRTKPVESAADGTFLITDVVPGSKFYPNFTLGTRAFEPVEKFEDRLAKPGEIVDIGNCTLRPKGDANGN
jgi:RNA polymerase sigma factor (sigma-70 family)